MSIRPDRLATLLVAAALTAAPAGGAEERSFEDCLREALAANPELRATALQTIASDRVAEAAGAERRPKLDLGASYFWSERPQRLVQPSFPNEPVPYERDFAEAVVELRTPLFDGVLSAAQRAAEETVRVEGFREVAARQELIVEVAASYLEVLERRAELEALEASLEALSSQLELAHALEAVGRIAPLDRLKVEVRVASLHQQISQARRDRDLAGLRLAALMGRPPEAPPVEPAGPPALPDPPMPGLEAAIESILADRPELAALRAEVTRWDQEVRRARAEAWPALDAYARWTRRSIVPIEDVAVGDGSESWGSAGLVVTVPLWDSGRRRARRLEAEALRDQVTQRLRAAEIRVAEEVQQFRAALADGRERTSVALIAVAQAAEAFDIERSSYELGRSTVNDVFDAQAALLDARLALAMASRDVDLSTIALTRAVGSDLEALLLGRE